MVTTRNGINSQTIYSRLNPASNLKEKTEPNKKYVCFLGEFETRLYWGNLIGIVTLHVLAAYGLLIKYPVWIYRWECAYHIFLGGLCGFGITAGAHRYWTHRSFKAKLPLQIILLFCYSLAGQNTVREWVRDHRVHHKFSETDADPHNANRGFWFAHVGWLCMEKHPEVLRKGKTVDISDITSDPLLAFHVRHWIWFKTLICFVLPSIIPPLIFGEDWVTSIYINCIIRYCLSLNFTWSVNSFAHIWGNKPFNKYIQPTENKFVSIVAMGEGWHNYHHSFPWDYRAAELGTPLNITTFFLDIFAKIGWAYDLKTTSPELVESIVKSKGDGSHTCIK